MFNNMNNNLKNYKNNTTLFYIHDPMCSWCWAFNRVWEEIQQQLPKELKVIYLLGGLAPDTDKVMPEALQQQISSYWKTIQQRVPNTKFNFNFWKNNQARRSTYPACRAVIAAKKQSAEKEMILAIQKGYYLEAKNPSDNSILIGFAQNLDLDVALFTEQLSHNNTQQKLLDEIRQGQLLGAQGFPSLVLQHSGTNHFIPIDYNNADAVLTNIQLVIES